MSGRSSRGDRGPNQLCKPCGQLPLDFIVRNTFAAIELIDSFLDRGEKLDSLDDFGEEKFRRATR